MTQLLRLVSAITLAIAPAVCVGEECQARQVLIQHGAELLLDVATTAEAPPARHPMPRATMASGWLESDSKESSSDAAGVWGNNQAKASQLSSRDALYTVGTDSINMISDLQYAISGGGHPSGNGPMWLRLHVAAGIIVFVAACIVMICRPPPSPPPPASEPDRGSRRSGASIDEAGSQCFNQEDSLANVPCLLASALVPCSSSSSSKDHDKTDDRRFPVSASSSTIATSGPRSSSVASSDTVSSQGDSYDRPSSPPVPADAATDDGDSGTLGSASNTTEDPPSLLIGDSANESSEDENTAGEKVSDTFEASGVYLSSATPDANAKQ
mmetsp:Transcript_48681/g.85759  ORF Transcript_48681/g.85759 Transcript_48681/m.85759 type:complete len:327 (-) Transcript_48681:50-1030(-)